MKLFQLVIILSSLLPRLALALEPGDSVPQFSLPRVGADEVVDNELLKGKITLIDFWATWCVPCRASLPKLKALQEQHGSKGFQVVSISIDKKPEKIGKFLDTIAPNFLVLHDQPGKVAESFNLPGMPTSFLVGRDGKVLAIFSGYSEEVEGKMNEQIARALEN